MGQSRKEEIEQIYQVFTFHWNIISYREALMTFTIYCLLSVQVLQAQFGKNIVSVVLEKRI